MGGATATVAAIFVVYRRRPVECLGLPCDGSLLAKHCPANQGQICLLLRESCAMVRGGGDSSELYRSEMDSAGFVTGVAHESVGEGQLIRTPVPAVASLSGALELRHSEGGAATLRFVDLLAGFSSGCAIVAVGHPFETVRTRMQTCVRIHETQALAG